MAEIDWDRVNSKHWNAPHSYTIKELKDHIVKINSQGRWNKPLSGHKSLLVERLRQWGEENGYSVPEEIDPYQSPGSPLNVDMVRSGFFTVSYLKDILALNSVCFKSSLRKAQLQQLVIDKIDDGTIKTGTVIDNDVEYRVGDLFTTRDSRDGWNRYNKMQGKRLPENSVIWIQQLLTKEPKLKQFMNSPPDEKYDISVIEDLCRLNFTPSYEELYVAVLIQGTNALERYHSGIKRVPLSNEFRIIPPSIPIVPDHIISYLDLSGMGYIIFPETGNNNLHNINFLTHIDLSNNYLTEIPSYIGLLTQLNSLNLSDNNLTDLPESLENLINLNSLNVSKNRFPLIKQSSPILQYEELTMHQVKTICGSDAMSGMGTYLYYNKSDPDNLMNPEPDDVVIVFEFPTEKRRMECELLSFIDGTIKAKNDRPPESLPAIWRPKIRDNLPNVMDDEGRGGTSAYPYTYVYPITMSGGGIVWVTKQDADEISFLGQLKKEGVLSPQIKIKLYPLKDGKRFRVGRQDGKVMVSGLHGQTPGEVIYTSFSDHNRFIPPFSKLDYNNNSESSMIRVKL